MTVATMTNGGLQQYAECGTESAYRRHLRKKEPVDQACGRAHAEVQAAYQRQRRSNRLPADAGYDHDRWRERAACFGVDGPFDHIGSEPTPIHRKAAQDYCARCPVIQQCADWADRWGEPGVWGGSYRNGSHGFHPLIKKPPRRRSP